MLCCCKAFLQYRLLVGSFLAITGFSLAASTGFFGAGVASICQVKSNVVKSLPASCTFFLAGKGLFPLRVMMVPLQCIHSKLVVPQRDFHRLSI